MIKHYYDIIWNFWYSPRYYSTGEYMDRCVDTSNLWLFFGWLALFILFAGIVESGDSKALMVAIGVVGGAAFAILFPVILWIGLWIILALAIYFIGVGSRTGFKGVRAYFNTEARLQKKLEEIEKLLEARNK